MIRARSHAGGYDRLCVEGRCCVIHLAGSEDEGAARRSSGRLSEEGGEDMSVWREGRGAEASAEERKTKRRRCACIRSLQAKKKVLLTAHPALQDSVFA